LNSEPASQAERVPQTCFWEITRACNLRCIHCLAAAGRRDPDELSGDQALALADELVRAGCGTVKLTGGEPLLRQDWPQLAARLTAGGLRVAIISNGLLLDQVRLERMLAAGVQAVAISLDGLRHAHDGIRVAPGTAQGSRFDAALRALALLASSPLETTAVTQIHRGNIHDLGRMHDLIAALGADAWQVQLAMPLGRLLEIRYEYLVRPAELPDLQRQLAQLAGRGRVKIAVADNIGYYGPHEAQLRATAAGGQGFWTGCTAGYRVVGIAANGDVKGCPSHPQPFVVGNVRRTPFGRIWREARNFTYNTAWDQSLLEGGCARCAHRRLCRAGCTTMAYAVTGTIYDNPFCVLRAAER